MPAFVEQSRKRPVNLTLNEALVAQAKAYTSNLSATMEALLADLWPASSRPNAAANSWPIPALPTGMRCMPQWAHLQMNTPHSDGTV